MIIQYEVGTRPNFEIRCEEETDSGSEGSELKIDGTKDYSLFVHQVKEHIDFGAISITASKIISSSSSCGPFYDLNIGTNYAAPKNTLGYVIFEFDEQ